jgi:hypothetical protein
MIFHLILFPLQTFFCRMIEFNNFILFCVTVTYCKPTKCTLLKLIFSFNPSCLLRVSNVPCSSSGRPYCTCSLTWYLNVFHPVVCYNNSKSKNNQSNTTLVIILDCVSKLATRFGLRSMGSHPAQTFHVF